VKKMDKRTKTRTYQGKEKVSPPRPGTNWADWSDAMGREMYLRRALDRLNFEYPSDDAS
jgi:hypothetical protein